MNKCIICYENTTNKYAFSPCGHYGICGDCKSCLFDQVGGYVLHAIVLIK